jgi:hypothetical protein
MLTDNIYKKFDCYHGHGIVIFLAGIFRATKEREASVIFACVSPRRHLLWFLDHHEILTR